MRDARARLDHFPWVVSALTGPVTERAAEAVHRDLAEAHALLQEREHCHVGQGAGHSRRRPLPAR